MNAIPGVPRIGEALAARPALPGAEAARGSQASFGELLVRALDQANRLQLEADQAALRLAAGQPVDLEAVVLAQEKAALALDLIVQVRNRAIEAYQEIMRLQV